MRKLFLTATILLLSTTGSGEDAKFLSSSWEMAKIRSAHYLCLRSRSAFLTQLTISRCTFFRDMDISFCNLNRSAGPCAAELL
jgi:hypothetical protein